LLSPRPTVLISTPRKSGGDLEYAQEITGRAMLALTEQIVQESH